MRKTNQHTSSTAALSSGSGLKSKVFRDPANSSHSCAEKERERERESNVLTYARKKRQQLCKQMQGTATKFECVKATAN